MQSFGALCHHVSGCLQRREEVGRRGLEPQARLLRGLAHLTHTRTHARTHARAHTLTHSLTHTLTPPPVCVTPSLPARLPLSLSAATQHGTAMQHGAATALPLSVRRPATLSASVLCARYSSLLRVRVLYCACYCACRCACHCACCCACHCACCCACACSDWGVVLGGRVRAPPPPPRALAFSPRSLQHSPSPALSRPPLPRSTLLSLSPSPSVTLPFSLRPTQPPHIRDLI